MEFSIRSIVAENSRKSRATLEILSDLTRNVALLKMIEGFLQWNGLGVWGAACCAPTAKISRIILWTPPLDTKIARKGRRAGPTRLRYALRLRFVGRRDLCRAANLFEGGCREIVQHRGRCADRCTPDAGLTACAQGCVDLHSDPLNCGQCGNTCLTGQSCRDGGTCSSDVVAACFDTGVVVPSPMICPVQASTAPSHTLLS